MTIGILGGGQLGYMLALAGYPLGLHFRFLDPSPEAPVGRIATRITAQFTDRPALKKFAAAVLGASFLTVNWMTTQHAASLIGDSPRLGPPLFVLPWTGPIYAPWKWMVWAWHWRAIERMKPLWVLSFREVLYPMAPLALLAVVGIAVTRRG